jgi:Phosphotransferase enzyme family
MAAKFPSQAYIDISSLPDISKTHMEFHDTSFFSSSIRPVPQLPSPTEVLQRYPGREAAVVKFEHLNLAVKYGPSDYFRLEEAQTMIAIRRAFPDNEIPVPEVFGWKKYGNKNLIYMSLVPGKTLREGWSTLTEEDKRSICGDLGRVVVALRRLTQGSCNHFIGATPQPSRRIPPRTLTRA